MSLFNNIFLSLLLLNINCYGSLLSGSITTKGIQDTSLEKQLIYNGKLWRNLYIRVKDDPFFLSAEFLSGDVRFNGKEFRNLKVKYDIFNDEVILWVNPQTIIVLNKEMISEFTFDYQNRSYHILNIGSDSTSLLHGFVHVLYDGPTTLFVKYVKKIELQPLDRKSDIFYQQHRIFVRIDSAIVQVSGKRELFKLLGDRKTEIRDYIRSNRLSVLRKDPDSFIPVLQFYDDKNR
jgi:hypothetical protein